MGNGDAFELEFPGSSGSVTNIDGSTSSAGGYPNGNTGINGSAQTNGHSSSTGTETYSWSAPERKLRPVDCLLIFDEETQVQEQKTKKKWTPHSKSTGAHAPTRELTLFFVSLVIHTDLYSGTATFRVTIYAKQKEQGCCQAGPPPAQQQVRS